MLGLGIERVFLAGIKLAPVGFPDGQLSFQFLGQKVFFQNGKVMFLSLQKLGDSFDFFVRDIAALDPAGLSRFCRDKEQVAGAQELFRSGHVNDGPGINL